MKSSNDQYTLMAADFFKIPPSSVTDAQRAFAKRTLYLRLYATGKPKALIASLTSSSSSSSSPR